MIYRKLLRPILFQMDPEAAHDAVIRWGQRCQRLPAVVRCCRKLHRYEDTRLATTIAGIRFGNPIGLAAGFDKSGRIVDLMASLGFGHVEIGSVSMDPSFGNPKPRLWRLPADEATQVHYGLPNDGSQRVAARLANVNSPVPLGINLVNTNRVCESARTSTDDDSVDTILDDYVVAAARLQPWASYLMLNLSCPNTIDGRGFFEHEGHLSELLQRLEVQRVSKPIFLKLSPSLDDGGLGELLGEVDAYPNVRGFMFNLSPRFRSGLKTPAEQWKHRPGAVSGAPIRDWMDDRVGWLYRQIDSARYHIIAAGGVSSGENAYRKIRRGASLVQLYTALIYHGPGVVRQIARGLSECLRRDGFERVEDAVGVDAK